MKVDVFKREAEGGTDPAGYVIDRQFADAAYVANPVVYRAMKIVKGLAGRDAATGQRICGMLKHPGWNSALMGMPLPVGGYGQCGFAEDPSPSGPIGPVGELALRARPVVTPMVANDIGQGLRRGSHGTSARRNCNRTA
ncbi:MAG: hypothetical protein OXI57_07095 [Rhodospirillales bacterium]|nr:hypothetical protein [Rhodospirillales bacterium]